MPDIYMDVDTAVVVPMNIMPLLDDTDFKSVETGLVYNSAGIKVYWHFVTCAGAMTSTEIHPTTGGSHDIAEPIADIGMYSIEIPASGGDHASNDTEGTGWITGIATGMLPFRGPTIGFRRAALNDLFIDGGTASTNLEDFFDGTGYAGGTAKLTVDVAKISGDSDAADNAELMFDGTGYAGGSIKTDVNVASWSDINLSAKMKTDVNAEVDTALNTAIPGSPTADSMNQRIVAIDVLTEAAGGGDLAAILLDTGTTLDTKLNNMSGATFDTGTDSLEAIRNKLPTNLEVMSVTAITGLVDITQTAADKAWGTAARVLTAGTNLNNLSAAEVNAEVVDALNVDTYAEPGQANPVATSSLASKIGYLYKSWRNKKTQTATEFDLYNDAGAVIDQKSTVSDDGTTLTSGEIGTGA